jgi:hypothetical protein
MSSMGGKMTKERLVTVLWKAPDPDSSQAGSRIVAWTGLPGRFSAALIAAYS